MAAEANAIRAYLRGDLAVGGTAANDNTRPTAIMDEGLSTWQSFVDTDEETIKDLCREIRRDPNNNLTIPAIAVKRIQTAVYAAKYYDLVGRVIDAQTMAWERILHFNDLKAIEDEYSSPEQISTVTKKLNIMKWVELLEEHVRKVRGVRKIPLSYLIRTAHVAAPVTPFPAGYELPFGSEYDSFHDEMIECASHTHPTYKADNEALFHIINTALADTEYAASIKRHIRTKDGRGAYLDICLHHQGSNKWKATAELADKKLTTMRWNGRSHRYTLAMHIANARTYHNDLLRASQYVPVDVPTEPTRVTRLLNSIETRDQFLISAIVEVKGDEGPNGKANDFELAADYLLKMLPTRSRDNVPSYQVSALEFDFSSESEIPTKGPSTGIDVRYHTKEEYGDLSPDEKEELAAIRVAARKVDKDFGKKPGNGNSNKGPKKKTRKEKRLAREIKALKASVAERDETISSLRSTSNNSQSTEQNPLERPTQRATINGRAATVLFD